MDRTPSDPFRIVVVDDEPSIRYGLRLRLDSEPDLQVVGETANGTEAIELVRQLGPDLVLMDLRLPGPDGFRATTALRRMCPSTPIVILTLYDNMAVRRQARRAGANDFVSKHDGEAALIASVRRVLTGLHERATATSGPSTDEAT